MSDGTNVPASWRDVYALVSDTAKATNDHLAALDAKLDTHLLQHALETGRAKGKKATTDAFFGIARSSLSIALSLAALAVSAAAALGVKL